MASAPDYLGGYLASLQHLAGTLQQQKQLGVQNDLEQQRQNLAQHEFEARQQTALGDQLANGANAVTNAPAGPAAVPTSPGAAAAPAGGDLQSSLSSASSAPAPMANPSAVLWPGNDVTANPDPASVLSPPAPAGAPAFTPQTPQDPAASPQGSLSAAPGGSFAGNAPANPAMQYQVAGKTLQAPSFTDQLARSTAIANAKTDAEKIAVPDTFADSMGLKRGTRMTPGDMYNASMAQYYATPASPDPVKMTHMLPETDDAGNVTMVQTFSDGTFKKVPLGNIGKSDKWEHLNALATAGGKPLTADARLTAANKMREGFYKAQADEEAARDQLDRTDHVMQVNDALNSSNQKSRDKGDYTAGVYGLKTYANGKSVPQQVKLDSSFTGQKLLDARNQVSDDAETSRPLLIARLQRAINEKYDYGDQLGQLQGGPIKWGVSKEQALAGVDQRLNQNVRGSNSIAARAAKAKADAATAAVQPAAPAPTATAPVAAAPTAPAAKAPANAGKPKTATLADIDAYATAHSTPGKPMTRAQAIAISKQHGYTLQGQAAQ